MAAQRAMFGRGSSMVLRQCWQKATLSSLIIPNHTKPYIYHPESSTWQGLSHVSPGLKRGSVLTIASWNVDWSSPDPTARTLAALSHLERVFGASSENLAVMLQEISPTSLGIILEHPWVQHNFVLSDIKPPESSRRVVLNQSSVLERSKQTASYFTVMMISKALPVLGCFRVPLVTNMGRDVLAIDIHTSSDGKASDEQDCVRLCTTHLESLYQGKAYRLDQLTVVSELLKRSTMVGRRVVAGVVGGDMNAIDRSEHDYHRAKQVNLHDVWEDAQREPPQEDGSYDEENGSTWGYQSPRQQRRDPKRMDKFFYSGGIETLAVRDAQEATGRRIGRFGIGLRTEVELWELEREEMDVVGGQLRKRPHKEYVSKERLDTLDRLGFLKSYKVRPTRTDSWVSDHFGITARMRIM